MNDDDEMVTLEVRRVFKTEKVRLISLNPEHPDYDAARRWVAAHDKPERREYRLYPNSQVYDGSIAVAVEDLQPGDRVAGREVEAVSPFNGFVDVHWKGTGGPVGYGVGSLVVLDGDQ